VHALTTSHVLAYEGRGANAYRFAMDLGRPLNPLAVNVLAASRFYYFNPNQSLREDIEFRRDSTLTINVRGKEKGL